MRSRITVLALVLASALSLYACKSVETTSAMLHNQTGNYEDAIAQAKAGLAKNPADAEAYFQLGISYSYTGEMRLAYESFMKAAELDPKKKSIAEDDIRSNWARHFNSGIAEFQSDNLEGAAQEFTLATDADPRMIKGWLNLANVYNSLAESDSTYWEKTFAVTDTLMARVGEEDDDYDKVLALAGQVMIVRGEKDQAYGIFERLMRDDPVNAEIVEDVGNRFLVNDQWEDAARFFQMAVDGRRQTETESFDLYYNLGVCQLQLEQYLLAADAFQNALVIDPDNRAGNYRLLLSYYQGEFWDEAVLQGEKYTEKFPDDPRGWQILSLVFNKKGMKIKAEEAAMKYQELVGG
ncbi:MAG: tetratricopeptide repeat protein [Candidatus Krumholzibacteria bacterium]|nr:tetratricopeptide repeat protein [Candidatus Krumholzibacteria bacterium]